MRESFPLKYNAMHSSSLYTKKHFAYNYRLTLFTVNVQFISSVDMFSFFHSDHTTSDRSELWVFELAFDSFHAPAQTQSKFATTHESSFTRIVTRWLRYKYWRFQILIEQHKTLMLVPNVPDQVLFSSIARRTVIAFELRRYADAFVSNMSEQIRFA